jgi:hypothetical protein
LEIEGGLVFGSSIGLAEEFPFLFEVLDETPIKQKAIPYNKTERQWINDYMTSQEELGIYSKVKPGDPEPTTQTLK